MRIYFPMIYLISLQHAIDNDITYLRSEKRSFFLSRKICVLHNVFCNIREILKFNQIK